MKSGTANYHGSLYEYHRNSALDANNWQNNAVGVKPSVLIQNQFGGTLGGPAPGMRKKLFFFASYEGGRSSTPRLRVRTIPDPAIHGGNFGGLPATISDPVSEVPFPNNIIPANRLDPAAVKFLSLFPTPNTAGILDARFGIRTQNWVRTGSRTDPQNYGVLRLDYNPTSKDKLFVTYLELREGPWDDVRNFDSPLNTIAGLRRRRCRFTVGYTCFLRPNLANDLLLYVYRDRRARTPFYPEFDVTRDPAQSWSQPADNIDQRRFGSYGNSNFDDYIWQPGGLNNVISYLRGRHTMKFGLQLYQNQYWDGSKGGVSGSYTFNGESTGRGAAGRNNPLNALADLLLGSVKTAGINVPRIPINRVNYNLGLFFQDDWKVTSRLTLNLGLRYEYETPPFIKNNVYSRVDLATGDLLVAGRNASKNLNRNTDYFNFSPRLGLAYLVNDKTVARAGFAVFHSNLWNDFGGLSYPGWSGSVSFVDQGLGRSQPFT